MHVKELDTISLIKLCGEDTGNYAAWQELFFRFSEKLEPILHDPAYMPEEKACIGLLRFL